MNKSKPIHFLFLLVWLSAGCFSSRKTNAPNPISQNREEIVEFAFLQINDVYEIEPGKSDNLGGLARVAQLRKNLLQKDSNLVTVLAGDFISPSIFSQVKHEGRKVRGVQMIEALNMVGVDVCVFGNHEFDYGLKDLQACLDASEFEWLGTNTRLIENDTSYTPFFKNRPAGKAFVPDTLSFYFSNKAGKRIKVGLFGTCLDVNPKKYLKMTDQYGTAAHFANVLKQNSDVTIGLTHQFLEQDSILAAQLPFVPLFMGGHEHEGHYREFMNTTVTKARSNAKTAYYIRLAYNTRTKSTTVESAEEILIDNSIGDNPTTAEVVAKWTDILYESLREQGINPNEEVTELKLPLDCRDEFLRSNQSTFGQMLAEAMYAAAIKKPDCALFNSGSVRIDDYLQGTLTQLDVARLLPYGGGLTEIDVKGDFLQKILDAGEMNKTKGGYLQRYLADFEGNPKIWAIDGTDLQPEKIYHIILPNFLLTGNEAGLEFLKVNEFRQDGSTDNPQILSADQATETDEEDLRRDVRLVLIEFLSTK